MARSQPEYALTVAVADFFRIALPLNVLWLHIPNGGHRTKITRIHLARMGVRAGAGDFLLSWWSSEFQQPDFMWIELKSSTGKPSREQERFAHDVENIGHSYYVCRSIADVEDALKTRRVPMRGRIAA